MKLSLSSTGNWRTGGTPGTSTLSTRWLPDEAHIVTTWGVGFRPDYWYLGSYINRLRNQIQTSRGIQRKVYRFPICAFTATAINGGIDDSVSDTVISLYMENPIKYIGYVRRDDIGFDIVHKRENKKLSKTEYEAAKTKALDVRIKEWLAKNEKPLFTSHMLPFPSEYDRLHCYAKPAYDQYQLAIAEGQVTTSRELEYIQWLYESLSYKFKRHDEPCENHIMRITGHEKIDGFYFHDSQPIHFEHDGTTARITLINDSVKATFRFDEVISIEINISPQDDYIFDFYCYPRRDCPERLIVDFEFYTIDCGAMVCESVESLGL